MWALLHTYYYINSDHYFILHSLCLPKIISVTFILVFHCRNSAAAQFKCYIMKCYNQLAHSYESFKALIIYNLFTFPMAKGHIEKIQRL